MADPVLKLIGRRLKALRDEQKLRVRELADAVGCGRGTIYNVESGRAAPSLKLVIALAKALRVDEIDLLCFPGESARHAVVELLRRVPISTVMVVRDAAAKIVADGAVTVTRKAGRF
jgi:transcriptional regulator with XRE-family HTH domain